MVKCSELFGVQFAQGQYLMHWEAAKIPEIFEKLFVHDNDVSVDYESLGSANGREEVKAFFEQLDEMRKTNGGLLRLDLPHTQKITVDDDGCHATGEWETMTFRVMGAAFGNDLVEAPLDYAIGRYQNRFALEDGLWKIQSIHWEQVLAFGDWKAKDATKVYGRPYPEPFEELSAVDDETSSAEAVTICNIRNQALSFFHDFNRIGLAAIDDRFSEDAAREARRMLASEDLVPGYTGTVLATSPIVALEEKRARLYLHIARILPTGDMEISHSQGRICAGLILDGDTWTFSEFWWYRYATLLPWKVRK